MSGRVVTIDIELMDEMNNWITIIFKEEYC